MIHLELHGMIDVNCYLIVRNGICLIVDPGTEKARLIETVLRENLQVAGILLTHAHVDHIGALDCFPVPVYLHEQEMAVIRNNIYNGFMLFRQKKAYDLASLQLVPITDGQAINLADWQIATIHTPGHTAGSVCYLGPDGLFTGDTLFMGDVGRTDLPTGSRQALRASVVRLMLDLPPETPIYPGHGPGSTLAIERASNPYCRKWLHSA